MKKLYILLLLFLLVNLNGCKFLGIGKQCYTCTTTASAGSSKSTSSKEICGVDEMKAYTKDNSGLKNGVSLSTDCQEK